MFLQATPCIENLPSSENPPTYGMKLHQVHQRNMEKLENILAGYVLPEPYFTEKLEAIIDSLIKSLKDPSLPLLELQACSLNCFTNRLIYICFHALNRIIYICFHAQNRIIYICIHALYKSFAGKMLNFMLRHPHFFLSDIYVTYIAWKSLFGWNLIHREAND